MVYLCGTKFDLVEENKKMRKVEFSVVKNYADGKNYQHNYTHFYLFIGQQVKLC